MFTIIVEVYPSIVHEWPLTANSALNDVVGGNNMHAPNESTCLEMGPSHPHLAGGSIDISDSSTNFLKVTYLSFIFTSLTSLIKVLIVTVLGFIKL